MRILVALMLLSCASSFAQMTKEELKAERERVKAEQKWLDQKAKEEKHAPLKPRDPVEDILSRTPTIDPSPGEVDKLYDIKGDRLGMLLKEFGEKYYSFTAGDAKKRVPDFIGPFCVDHEDSLLLLSSDDAAAGVIACFPGDAVYAGDVPAFNRSTHAQPQTFANVILKSVSYQFYRGRLFRIAASFDASNYETMKAAFVSKFGTPKATESEAQNRYEAKFANETVQWSNGTSAIEMRQRFTDLETSFIVMAVPSVQQRVDAARPKPKQDL